nr:DUF1697 domain-containing protein [Ignavibacteriaceae bacterium]
QIKMSTLKLLFEELRFHNVETYIQSGNVIFSSKEKLPEKLEQKISSAIKRKFGFDVRVMVLTPEEIEYVLNNNPFIKRKKESEKLYVTFLAKSPSDENINKLNAIDYSPEEYIIDGRYIYLFVPNGYGKAKLNNNLFESKLNASATTRNWKTVNKMFELSTSN